MESRVATTGSASSQKLPLRTRIIFGLGDWGGTTSSTALMFFFAFFLTDIAHLPPVYAGMVLLIGGIWDAINDPLIGVYGDRMRSRWGRRRPFFLIGAVPFALFFTMMWWIPPFQQPLALMAYYTLAYILFDTFFTLVSVPYSAMTPELTDNYDERTSLSAYRMSVSLAGGVITAVAVPLFADAFPEKRTGYLVVAAIIGVLGSIPYLLLFFNLRERFAGTPEPSMGILEGFVHCLKNRAFRYTAGLYLMAWSCVSLIAALLQYYLTYWLKMADQLEIVLGLIQLVALFCIPAVVWGSGKLGKPGVFLAGASWWVVAMFLISLLPFAAPHWMVYALVVSVAFGVACAHVIPWSLIPDVIEVDELETGQRREGVYYGFMVFIQKSGTSFVLAVMQWVLAATGYVANGVQPSSALMGMRVLIGPAPALLLIGAMVLAWKYPITRASHQQLVEQLEKKRAAQNPPAG